MSYNKIYKHLLKFYKVSFSVMSTANYFLKVVTALASLDSDIPIRNIKYHSVLTFFSEPLLFIDTKVTNSLTIPIILLNVYLYLVHVILLLSNVLFINVVLLPIISQSLFIVLRRILKSEKSCFSIRM